MKPSLEKRRARFLSRRLKSPVIDLESAGVIARQKESMEAGPLHQNVSMDVESNVPSSPDESMEVSAVLEAERIEVQSLFDRPAGIGPPGYLGHQARWWCENSLVPKQERSSEQQQCDDGKEMSSY